MLLGMDNMTWRQFEAQLREELLEELRKIQKIEEENQNIWEEQGHLEERKLWDLNNWLAKLERRKADQDKRDQSSPGAGLIGQNNREQVSASAGLKRPRYFTRSCAKRAKKETPALTLATSGAAVQTPYCYGKAIRTMFGYDRPGRYTEEEEEEDL